MHTKHFTYCKKLFCTCVHVRLLCIVKEIYCQFYVSNKVVYKDKPSVHCDFCCTAKIDFAKTCCSKFSLGGYPIQSQWGSTPMQSQWGEVPHTGEGGTPSSPDGGLKILPSLILRMRAVIKRSHSTLYFLVATFSMTCIQLWDVK